ncbi:unnamed protein product [Hydatigera taeniaeformis]|uniref:Recep_L_domain domain-containing protein n=1 Tax=Hydatigena taeniaeformis TaxID=6205 RepID=A0A0R3WJZ6_HYDTA|nr:unnamed protein product [Hydatigera taeniaeformis]
MYAYYRQSRFVQFKTTRYVHSSLNGAASLENGSDPDLSFLNSIREVSGYVYIGNNEVKRIPLISLRIIRGRVPYHVENVGDGALIVTRNAKNYTHGLEVLDLRSLTVIQEHNIIAWDNPMLCHFQYTVDCPQLFVDVKNQRRLSVSKENLISGSGCDYGACPCVSECLQHPVQCQQLTGGTDSAGSSVPYVSVAVGLLKGDCLQWGTSKLLLLRGIHDVLQNSAAVIVRSKARRDIHNTACEYEAPAASEHPRLVCAL